MSSKLLEWKSKDGVDSAEVPRHKKHCCNCAHRGQRIGNNGELGYPACTNNPKLIRMVGRKEVYHLTCSGKTVVVEK